MFSVCFAGPGSLSGYTVVRSFVRAADAIAWSAARNEAARESGDFPGYFPTDASRRVIYQ